MNGRAALVALAMALAVAGKSAVLDGQRRDGPDNGFDMMSFEEIQAYQGYFYMSGKRVPMVTRLWTDRERKKILENIKKGRCGHISLYEQDKIASRRLEELARAILEERYEDAIVIATDPDIPTRVWFSVFKSLNPRARFGIGIDVSRKSKWFWYKRGDAQVPAHGGASEGTAGYWRGIRRPRPPPGRNRLVADRRQGRRRRKLAVGARFAVGEREGRRSSRGNNRETPRRLSVQGNAFPRSRRSVRRARKVDGFERFS